MLFAIFNNITEIVVGVTWSTVVLTFGIKIGRRLEARRFRKLYPATTNED